MPSRYLVVYDYGMGGLWAYVTASSATEILDAFPELEVVHEQPEWMDDAERGRLDVLDIERPSGLSLRSSPAAHSDISDGCASLRECPPNERGAAMPAVAHRWIDCSGIPGTEASERGPSFMAVPALSQHSVLTVGPGLDQEDELLDLLARACQPDSRSRRCAR